MSKRRGRMRSRSEKILWLLSLIIAGSMVISLIIVAIPSGPGSSSAPLPTWTLAPTYTPQPTNTPLPFPTMGQIEPTVSSEPPAATSEATSPPMGPELPTEQSTGPELPSATPTVTPTLSITPTTLLPDFTFAICGDSRGNPAVYRRVLDAVTSDGSQFLVNTGDLVNNGTETQWKEFTSIMTDFSLPFYPVPGNHDAVGGSLDGYLASSGAPSAHYAFDRGSIHFAMADSHNGGIGSDELAWLREDLSASTQAIKMVFLHHPPFDPDGTDHIMAYGNDEFMQLMAEQKVSYVFAGHIHAYAQEVRDGVLYTITGGAGAPLYKTDHPQSFYHYLRVTVQGENIAVDVVQI